MIAEVVQPHADSLIAFIRDRSQVDILFLAVASDQFHADVNQLLQRIGKFYLHDFAGTQQTLIVFAEAEQIDLLVVLIPVAANALKAPRAISKAVRAYRDDALLGWYELAVHKKFFCIHLL